VFIHSTRGGTSSLQADYEATVNFASHQNPTGEGPHFVVGPTSVTRMIHDDDECYNQTVDNPLFCGVEVAQPTYMTRYVDFQYQATADICARWSIKYEFPAVYLGKQYTSIVRRRGILGHEDAYSGWSRGKSDPGPMWNWAYFMGLVDARIKELTVPPVTTTCPGQAKMAQLTGQVEAAENRIQTVLDWLTSSAALLDAAVAKNPADPTIAASAKAVHTQIAVLQAAKNTIWNNGVAFPRQLHGLP
jgi:hypothetical protein